MKKVVMTLCAGMSLAASAAERPTDVTSVAKAMEVGKAMVGRPNVIFMLADDMGYSDVSCYGSKKVSTPNLDHLAAEGLQFTVFTRRHPSARRRVRLF